MKELVKAHSLRQLWKTFKFVCIIILQYEGFTYYNILFIYIYGIIYYSILKNTI